MFLKLHPLLIALTTALSAISVLSVGGSDIAATSADAALSSNNPQAPLVGGQSGADNDTFTLDDKEKASRYISIIDRLLNRNQNRVTGTGASTATGTATGTGTANTANAASGVRPAVSPIFGKVPDVSAGIDTILNGVASGNLEQIISGSFIFSPNRVQNVANGVINRVFGGSSISTINNPANTGTVGGATNSVNSVANSQTQQQGAAGLVQAVNDIRQQPVGSIQQPQQLQPVGGGVANNNIQSGSESQQQGQLNRIPGQSGIGNLINAVLGGFLLG